MNEWMEIWDESVKNDPVVNILKGSPRKEVLKKGEKGKKREKQRVDDKQIA